MKTELERTQETLNMTRRAMKEQYTDLKGQIDKMEEELNAALEEVDWLTEQLGMAGLEIDKWKNKYINEKYTYIGFGKLKRP